MRAFPLAASLSFSLHMMYEWHQPTWDLCSFCYRQMKRTPYSKEIFLAGIFFFNHLSWSCESNFVYAHVKGYSSPCSWPISWQNVDNSRWKPSLSKQYQRKQGLEKSAKPNQGGINTDLVRFLLQWRWTEMNNNIKNKKRGYLFDEGPHVETAEWCLFSGFDDHRVSTAQRRGDLPGHHQQWEVPLWKGKEKGWQGYTDFSLAHHSLHELNYTLSILMQLTISYLNCRHAPW